MQTFVGFPPSHQERPAYLTIGNFDGVHRGHQALVAAMVQAAHDAGCLAGVLTFDPHPRAVLRPDLFQASLTSTEERTEILAALGLDCVIILPFSTAVAGRSAAEFMADLTGNLPLKELWIGPDFALGRGREGTAARLAEIGDDLGYKVHIAPLFNHLGDHERSPVQPVRSSRIRALLQEEGDAGQAADLLGRPYQVIGTVTEGARRGRTLGFPTANLLPPAGRLAPANGVYACWAWLGDAGHRAVVNIGVRPTFDNAARSIEAFLLDFQGDLYGETLGLSFVARLRGEQRFAIIDALTEQIAADIAAARRILGAPPNDAGQVDNLSYWTELRHTADWAIRVTGDSQRQLFARAAAAMYQLQDADLSRPVTLARRVHAEAGDTAGLLVAWLNRLLLGQEIGFELYTRFEFHALSPRGLSAIAYGYAGAPAHTAIKAVTYHDLEVTQTHEGWTARITFDV